MIAFLVTAALFTSAGYATTRWWPLLAQASRVEQVAEAFLRGVGVVGTVLFVIAIAGVPLELPVFIGVFGVAIGLAVRRQAAGEERRYSRLATALLLIPFAAVLFDAAVLPLTDWDGLITWYPKARAIATEAAIDGPFFQGTRGLNLHNHYPLLLPLDAAAVMRLSGSVTDASIRWLYALIPLTMLLMVRGRLTGICGPSTSAWIVAVGAWIPIVTTGYGSATSGYSDLAVAAFAGAALLSFITTGDAAPWLLFLVLTKNDGAMVCLALLVAAVAARWIRSIRELALTLSAPVAGVLLLARWHSLVPDAYDERYTALLPTLPSRLGHVPAATSALFAHMLDPKSWGFLWPAALIAGVIGMRRRRTLVAALAILLVLAGDIAIYAVTSWDIATLARVTADRLLLHLVVPMLTLLALGWSNVTAENSASKSPHSGTPAALPARTAGSADHPRT